MKLQEVLGNILKIEEELGKLNGSFIEWAEEYQKKDFKEQLELAVCLENKVHMVTHEISSEIGFIRWDIELLVKFIEFRRRWNKFSDDELSRILDVEMVKLKLKKELMETQGDDIGGNLKEIRDEWNKLFPYMPYGIVKERFK